MSKTWKLLVAGTALVAATPLAPTTAAETTTATSTTGTSTARATAQARFGGGFTVASLNALGASHTAPGGKHPQMAGGVVRTARALRLLARHDVDVVGLQELQRVQARTFRRLGGERWRLWSPPGDTENSVAWRRSTFAFVSARTVAIPYFDGNLRRMPVVRLRVRSSGQQVYVANFHNPADTRRFPRQARWRARATARQIALARRLADTGLPVLVTGDMNERHRYFCRVTVATDLHSAFGGSRTSPCRPPGYSGIDWIFGNRRTDFGRRVVDRSALVRRTTDHPMVVAEVDYEPGRNPGPLTPR